MGTQTWHCLCHSLPPNAGCCSPGMVQRGQTGMGKRSPACVMWGSQEGFCYSLHPPLSVLPFLSTPNSSPQVLLCCRMWLCQAALLHSETVTTHRTPTLHCPALKHPGTLLQKARHTSSKPLNHPDPLQNPIQTPGLAIHPPTTRKPHHTASHRTALPWKNMVGSRGGREMFYLGPHLPLIRQAYF